MKLYMFFDLSMGNYNLSLHGMLPFTDVKTCEARFRLPAPRGKVIDSCLKRNIKTYCHYPS